MKKNETLLKEKWYYEANYPLGNKISFVSDMTIAKSELIIAYGAGDAESRIFIVKLRDIDHYFTDWLPNETYITSRSKLTLEIAVFCTVLLLPSEFKSKWFLSKIKNNF